MQALILAAGRGTRLKADHPKSLIEIGGRTLLARLIGQLRRHGILDVRVVTGYKAEEVQKELLGTEAQTIHNPYFDTSDNLVSFWIGQKAVEGDCIFSHGDLIFDDELLEELLHARGDIILPMDRSSVNKEAMKFELADGKITRLSKQIAVKKAAGESIPLMRFSADALDGLRDLTTAVVEAGHMQTYLEDAIGDLVQNEELMTTVLNVTGLRWIEIDTKSDLKKARKMFV